jgi:hypothetical protein
VTGHSRRSLLAAAGTALTGALAGCTSLLSDETRVEYDQSALADIPSDLPTVPAAEPVQPTPAHLEGARERIRSLLADTDISRIPNAAVRERLDREAASAREALSESSDDATRVDALAGLTHPRSEAMFVHAGLAAFDGDLDERDLAARRDRQRREATALLDDYRYVSPPEAPAATLAQHARIVGWARTGSRLLGEDERHEFENEVLHAGELAADIEWGRAYANDARRLRDHYRSTLSEPTDYGDRFARAADNLVDAVETHAEAPNWETLASGFDRDIEDTAAEMVLEELARSRLAHAQNAVEDRGDGRPTLAVVGCLQTLAADRAFVDATDAVETGAYGIPESVEPIAAARTAAVEGLQTLLDTAPAPLARRLAAQVATQIRAADRRVDRGRVASPGDYLYAEYATAKHLAAAALPAVRRVGDALVG